MMPGSVRYGFRMENRIRCHSCKTAVRKVVLLILLAGLGGTARAQDTIWVRRYAGTGSSEDIPSVIAMDSTGKIYVTGESYGQGNAGFDFVTIQYDPQGDSLWVRRWDGPGNGDDHPQAVALDRAGNVYVTGWTGEGGIYYNYETIKYRPNGDTVWSRSYDGPSGSDDYGRALVLDRQGSPVVTGWSYVIGSNSSFDIVTLKYDTNGTLLDSADYNGPGHSYDRPNAMIRDDSDQVYIIGESSDPATGYDYITLKYDPQLQLLWERRYTGLGGNRDDIGRSIARGSSGSLYVSGYSFNDTSVYAFATLRYSPSGDTQWVRRYHHPSTGSNYVTAMALDRSENIYVTGYAVIPTSPPQTDYLTVKYDSSGNLLWARTYDGSWSGADEANAIAVDPQGNAFVTGQSQGTGGSYDFATLLYDPDGAKRWEARYDGGIAGDDKATAVALDGQGCLYVTGGSWGSGSGTDYVTIKYLPTVGVEAGEGPRSLARAPEIRILPNPMREQCVILYSSSGEENQKLVIYDVMGRAVRSLAPRSLSKRSGDPGSSGRLALREYLWDGRDGSGKPLPSGVYFCRVNAGERGSTKRITLIR